MPASTPPSLAQKFWLEELLAVTGGRCLLGPCYLPTSTSIFSLFPFPFLLPVVPQHHPQSPFHHRFCSTEPF